MGTLISIRVPVKCIVTTNRRPNGSGNVSAIFNLLCEWEESLCVVGFEGQGGFLKRERERERFFLFLVHFFFLFFL